MKSLHGSIRWNMGFGAIGFLISTLISLNSNVWGTSLLRGLFAFIIWFLVAYGLRYVAQVLRTPEGATLQGEHTQDAELNVGASVNISTPDDTESLYSMLHSNTNEDNSSVNHQKEANDKEGEGNFTPLTPPKLVSKPMNDEQMAQAVRHLIQQ